MPKFKVLMKMLLNCSVLAHVRDILVTGSFAFVMVVMRLVCQYHGQTVGCEDKKETLSKTDDRVSPLGLYRAVHSFLCFDFIVIQLYVSVRWHIISMFVSHDAKQLTLIQKVALSSVWCGPQFSAVLN